MDNIDKRVCELDNFRDGSSGMLSWLSIVDESDVDVVVDSPASIPNGK